MESFDSNSVLGWTTFNYYDNIGAIAYVGDYVQPYDRAIEYGKGYNAGTLAHDYLVLGADGRLYRFRVTPYYNYFAYTEQDRVNYDLVRSLYGNINMKFADYKKLSMTYVELNESSYGLIIADGSTSSLYYVNLAAEELKCEKIGKLTDATAITALYTTTPVTTNRTLQTTSDDTTTAMSVLSMQEGIPASEQAARGDLSAAEQYDGAVHAAKRTALPPSLPPPHRPPSKKRTTP